MFKLDMFHSFKIYNSALIPS